MAHPRQRPPRMARRPALRRMAVRAARRGETAGARLRAHPGGWHAPAGELQEGAAHAMPQPVERDEGRPGIRGHGRRQLHRAAVPARLDGQAGAASQDRRPGGRLMGTAREALVEQLKPALPKDWKFVEHQRNLDRLAQTTVVLKQESIAKLTAAPLHWLHVTFTITIIDPGTDVVQAEAG